MINLKDFAKHFKKMSSEERLETLKNLLNKWPDYPRGTHRNIIMGGGKFIELSEGARWIKFAIIQGTGGEDGKIMRDIYFTADLKKLKMWFLDNAHEVRIHDSELRVKRTKKYSGKRPPDKGESWFAEGRWFTNCPFCHECHELIATDRFQFPWHEMISMSPVKFREEDPDIRWGDYHLDYVDIWKCRGCGYNSVWHQGNEGMSIPFMSRSLKECRTWIRNHWIKILDKNMNGYPFRSGDFFDAFRTPYDMKSHTKIWKRDNNRRAKEQRASEKEIEFEKRMLKEGKEISGEKKPPTTPEPEGAPKGQKGQNHEKSN